MGLSDPSWAASAQGQGQGLDVHPGSAARAGYPGAATGLNPYAEVYPSAYPGQDVYPTQEKVYPTPEVAPGQEVQPTTREVHQSRGIEPSEDIFPSQEIFPNPDIPVTPEPQRAIGDHPTRLNRHGEGRIRRFTRYKIEVKTLRFIWAVIFFAVVFLPLGLAQRAGGEMRPWSRGGMAIELCLTTGLLGLSTLAATVILPSRMRSISRAFGIEGVMRSHRLLALITTGLVLIHVLFVAIDRPANVVLLYPVTGPPRARAGETATIALILLCWLSLRRRKHGTRYEMWRMVHALLAVAAIAGTYVHIYFLNHLMQDVAERSVFYAILLFIVGVFANRWLLRPLKSRRRAYVIKGVRGETPTTSTMVLSPARRRQKALKYRPGQFAWIRLDSPFGPLQGHPFTMASAPHNPRELEFTIRNAGDFTGSIVVLTPGRKVFVDGPYGDFNDDHLNCKSLLLISAGIGITPMMSILRSHAHRRDRRPHVLLVCARTEEELMFRDELRHLEKIMNLTVIEVLSNPPLGWAGVGRRLDREVLDWVFESRSTLRSPSVFVCGPPKMMTDVRVSLADMGIDDKNIHSEDFSMV
ncbi:MAG TPA: ferredoxin reductase family protein [Kineosporiaceae bacterium]|nr:ferredoxin reductase family protein [Kineosporiaceae bacterium]